MNSIEDQFVMKKSNSTHHGHRRRMTENFMSVSNAPLTDIQFIEMLLFYCIPRNDTNPTAHKLLDKFKSIYGVLTAAEEELSSIHGMGKASAKKLRRISNAFFKYRALMQESRSNTALSKKIICDTIILSLRDTVRHSKVTPPFMLLCFSDDGKLIYRTAFRNRIIEQIQMLSATYPKRDSAVSILCASESCLHADEKASKELDSLTKNLLSSCKIDMLALIQKDMTIKFTVL